MNLASLALPPPRVTERRPNSLSSTNKAAVVSSWGPLRRKRTVTWHGVSVVINLGSTSTSIGATFSGSGAPRRVTKQVVLSFTFEGSQGPPSETASWVAGSFVPPAPAVALLNLAQGKSW